MGIDFGDKKIGIALSDERSRVAFPHSTLVNDEHAVKSIAHLVAKERVQRIVAGDTRTESGKENPITGAYSVFVANLSRATGIAVIPVSESGSTAAARAVFLEGGPRGEVASLQHRALDDRNLDARAAAVILQRFLDTQPQ